MIHMHQIIGFKASIVVHTQLTHHAMRLQHPKIHLTKTNIQNFKQSNKKPQICKIKETKQYSLLVTLSLKFCSCC